MIFVAPRVGNNFHPVLCQGMIRRGSEAARGPENVKGFGCQPHEGRRRLFIGAKRTSRDARLESVGAKFIGSRTDGDSTCSLHDGQIT